jgi:zinc and cadmium transporter
MSTGTNTLLWIIGSGLLMSAVALVGSVTLLLPERTLQRILLPLVAFSAGSLLGGAFLHMLPAALKTAKDDLSVYVWTLAGFSVFLLVEQFLHWHHCQRAEAECRKPLTYLILIGDGLHNFIGGLSIAAIFLTDIRLGITAWLAAVAHEIPQELGDLGVLLHGGWSKRKALAFNFISALTFLVGGLVTYAVSFRLDVSFLIPFAAGNFIYIGASDLVPEVKRHENPAVNLIHFVCFIAGIGLLLGARVAFGH